MTITSFSIFVAIFCLVCVQNPVESSPANSRLVAGGIVSYFFLFIIFLTFCMYNRPEDKCWEKIENFVNWLLALCRTNHVLFETEA